MEIILLKYHKGLGEKNDIVSVKPGYARNYLIPQGIARLATKTAKKHRENIRAKLGVNNAVEAARIAVRLGLIKA